ncbi:MAG: phosphoribosylaminoimidazolesuccinocarboxamide synthase, partial [Candidatus Lindowbacteria bacterium RIFCSPLOWO2_02_FULL_62_12]
GKAKRLYLTDRPDELLMEFKDDATAFNGLKKTQFKDKGRINKRLTYYFLNLLEQDGIPTHLVRDVDDTHLIVRRVEIIPVEVVVRNTVAGSLAKRTGWEEGRLLSSPIFEYYYKSDELGDPMITQEHIREMRLATVRELNTVRFLASQVNDLLTGFFKKIGIRLVDFKLEFGRLCPQKKDIILADEITPDTCRLWDTETGKILDKDRFRRDMGDVMGSYSEVLGRVAGAVHA